MDRCFPDARYAGAARALFGLPPAEAGQNLTARRDLAAEQAGHEVHHFRKRVEPKLIEQVAWELLADARPPGRQSWRATHPQRPPVPWQAMADRLQRCYFAR